MNCPEIIGSMFPYRAWRIVSIHLMSALLMFPIAILFMALPINSDFEPITDAVVCVLFYLVPGYWLYMDARKKKIDFIKLVGATVKPKKFPVVLPAVFFLLLTSLGCAYLEYLPLSYVFPEFVQNHLMEDDTLGFLNKGRYCQAVNGINLLVIVIIAPVVEEFVSRGFLLTRWASKWGVSRSILLTSVMFGLLHPHNFIGLTVVGIVLSLLYIRTRTLIIPIIVHMVNNLVVSLWVLHDLLIESETAVEYSVRDFQGEWWIGALSLAVGLPWTVAYIKKNWPDKSTRAPYYYV